MSLTLGPSGGSSLSWPAKHDRSLLPIMPVNQSDLLYVIGGQGADL